MKGFLNHYFSKILINSILDFDWRCPIFSCTRLDKISSILDTFYLHLLIVLAEELVFMWLFA